MVADLLQLHSPPPSVRSHFLTHHHLPTISATSLSTFQPSLPNKSHPFITTPTKPHNRRLKITAAHFNFSFPPLISSHESRSLGNMDLALHSWCIRPLVGEGESAERAERCPGQHSDGARHNQPQHHC
ncbi:uncharacterized protein LOC131255721 [Magnolia sinica]|uniref:uncharacterized protein LOC131255721 n=1 Tax=Magnolia sinica TaxID=86752 RepID=UPI00265ABF40|nr:uncharacterized protein LOC131255721 [Magnolia sinica]